MTGENFKLLRKFCFDDCWEQTRAQLSGDKRCRLNIIYYYTHNYRYRAGKQIRTIYYNEARLMKYFVITLSLEKKMKNGNIWFFTLLLRVQYIAEG